VGGEEARRALTRLMRKADEDERDFIQDALENLDFTEEMHNFSVGLLDEEGDEPDDEDDELKARLN
jgi:hypothetical protein